MPGRSVPRRGAGTLIESAKALHDAGARPELLVAATHGLLLGDAIERLLRAGVREMYVTDSVPPPQPLHAAVRVISMAPRLASAIRREVGGESFQELYERAPRPSAERRADAPNADASEKTL